MGSYVAFLAKQSCFFLPLSAEAVKIEFENYCETNSNKSLQAPPMR